MAYEVGRCLLREILDNKGMKQSDLAVRLNVTKQQINKYAQDKQRMSLEVAKNIAVILDCHIEDLYQWDVVGNNE
ncbi:transcriptional regulator [Sporosarcina sp. P21c]|uniref:helix-turn-helix transcriptional regulator n=1 Tax=Sporosarcina sp. P21c TaxID=2048255 RepID=UPI000C16853F|nr:helix-turn-helix transcriptional regulator [Sporosarcina sp. P21c]PIC88397.1 transcriptional regulator [Sporosarcina sp. P21c]